MRCDAARGFRFIRSPADSADIFLHKQDFRDTAMPREGLTVTFKEIHVGGKGPRAMAVQATAHAVHAPHARPINATSAGRPAARSNVLRGAQAELPQPDPRYRR
ncbi:MAG: cold shock domain-containing protein [Polaromonas sp.]|nr:cold shock domain-containing protein [Polaromonas sp.]